MMRALYLSTARAADVNTKLVLFAATNQLLTSVGDVASTAAAGSPGAASVEGLDVFLHVHDNCRSTFLYHAQRMYGAAVAVSPTLHMDVIPIRTEVPLSTAQASDGEADDPELLKALYVAATEGFSAARQGAPIECYTADAMRAAAAAGGFNPVYKYVAVGGTFDHLHAGHKLLLTTAALHATEKLRCGITGDELLVKKKFAEKLQPIEERTKAAESFLRRIRPDLTLELAAISDVSGGTDTIPDVEALTVSPETERSLSIINDLRAKNGGLAPLVGVPIPYVTAPDGRVISSTEIRQRSVEAVQ
uniref:Pantetheine-phosphate adenylyltransferase n=1 Tax=Herpetomonas muscarum TaxID=5718 RepID=T1YTB2_HERMU|nr:pantetheine-phosphate adenylyltransferase [Herpetomonas muscarum]